MEQKYYTNERNVQIVISLLKQNGIKRVIGSPGTTNMTFLGSIQSDPFFEIYSSVDERSAAYLACGLASETGEPVVLSCTGATASRNYLPGLTEAYYRKLPVLAITSHRGDSEIGHLKDQQIDRRSVPADVVMASVTVPMVKDATSERFCIDEANKAIIALKENGGGPAHINLFTEYSKDFSVKSLPEARLIHQYTSYDKWPDLPKGKIGIYIGAHQPFTSEEEKAIDDFCATYDAVVFMSHISGYHGKYGINFTLVCSQLNHQSPFATPDLMIHIGEISGTTSTNSGKTTWRVSPDGKIRDTFHNLAKVFKMPERIFFSHYANPVVKREQYLKACIEEDHKIRKLIPELPFSNLWVAQELSLKLPEKSRFFMGILNSLRAWNFFPLTDGVYARCNVGGYGIDGGISTMIGASFAHKDTLYIGVFGDLSFFYDMNVIGNRHVGNNVRILLINNGKGAEFRLFNHPCSIFGEEADLYLAAAGHYGNKSKQLIKHYAEDLGYDYLGASNKEEFQKQMDIFVSPHIGERPIIFEVFTDSKEESRALEIIRTIEKPSFVETAKGVARRIVPEVVYEAVKQVAKK